MFIGFVLCNKDTQKSYHIQTRYNTQLHNINNCENNIKLDWITFVLIYNYFMETEKRMRVIHKFITVMQTAE